MPSGLFPHEPRGRNHYCLFGWIPPGMYYESRQSLLTIRVKVKKTSLFEGTSVAVGGRY